MLHWRHRLVSKAKANMFGFFAAHLTRSGEVDYVDLPERSMYAPWSEPTQKGRSGGICPSPHPEAKQGVSETCWQWGIFPPCGTKSRSLLCRSRGNDHIGGEMLTAEQVLMISYGKPHEHLHMRKQDFRGACRGIRDRWRVFKSVP